MNTPTTMETEAHADNAPFVPLGHASPDPEAERESAAIMADMAGGADAPLDVAAPRRKVRISSQVVMMVGVLAMSVAALYFMRRLGTGAGMTFVQPPLDFVIDKDPPDRLADHQRMLHQLEALGITPQVPPEDVQKNPFHLVDPEHPEAIASDDPDAAAKLAAQMARERAAARQKEIDRALASVTVHSVINGTRPVANVNDGLVGIGDTIAGLLTVVEIRDRSIVVSVDDQRHTITMKEKPASTRRRPRR